MATAKKSTKASKKSAPKNLYYPAKTFDDDLSNLYTYAVKKKFAVSNVDLAQIGQDAKTQRADREEHDAAHIAFEGVHRGYGEATYERYQRFASLLAAMKGAYKHDAAVMAELAKFKRVQVRRAKAVKPAG